MNNNDNLEKITSFDDMELSDNLLRGIYAYGFESPSTIQQLSIGPIQKGRDIIAQAQSGTGKTAAYLIPTLSSIDKRLHEPQALILAPTRELAIQIYTNATGLNTYTKFDIGLLIGGNDHYLNENGEKTFREDCQLIIGTHGKVFYMMNKHYLRSSSLKIV